MQKIRQFVYGVWTAVQRRFLPVLHCLSSAMHLCSSLFLALVKRLGEIRQQCEQDSSRLVEAGLTVSVVGCSTVSCNNQV